MPHRNAPRRGSLQYWPRKRARRIYPRQRFKPSSDAKPLGFAGWKAGMTHVILNDTDHRSPTYGRAVSKAVTVVDAPSLFVACLRFYKKTPSGMICAGEKWSKNFPKELDIKSKTAAKAGSGADAIGADEVRLLVATQPAESGMRKKRPELFEIAVGGEAAEQKKYGESVLGKEIGAKEVFKIGEFADVSAVTKGHGYTGPVKRYGIRIQTRKDKQMHRHVGSIGSTVPRKVDWRVPQSGQYGFFTRTEFTKRIVMIDSDAKKITPAGGFVGYGIPKSFIMIEGSVPGPRKRLIRLRHAVRRSGLAPPEIKEVSLQSKQGR